MFSLKLQAAGTDMICQETLLILDVGIEKSLLRRSKGSGIHEDKATHDFNMYGDEFPDAGHVQRDLHNSAASSQVLLDYISISASYQSNSSRCPVCLHYQGSCRQNFAFCPKDTGCYDGEIAIEGGECWRLHPQDEGDRGGVNANFSIKGCLDVTTEVIFKADETLGIFSVLENVNSMTAARLGSASTRQLVWSLSLLCNLLPALAERGLEELVGFWDFLKLL
ncbi:CD177 antigen-like [Onychomys torridus]|uniref:CD177 antigen-like n=1 Tax=Onychomys torridus TaxID=38674 RepID=UPI00167F8541|nr:CD177 antigen-like [Onychomys torridus]